MSTDYDCWKEDEEPVTWDEILAVFNRNADNVKTLLVGVIQELKESAEKKHTI
jgi:5'-methylthioadenosine phosphorylase